jgi:hypothetical protein
VFICTKSNKSLDLFLRHVMLLLVDKLVYFFMTFHDSIYQLKILNENDEILSKRDVSVEWSAELEQDFYGKHQLPYLETLSQIMTVELMKNLTGNTIKQLAEEAEAKIKEYELAP